MPADNRTEQSETAKWAQGWRVLPDVVALLKPRRGILFLGFVLMILNRVTGLVLPASAKYLLDNVILQRQAHLLVPLLLAVLAATLVQGATAYALTQLMSRASQRLIVELRLKVQAHIGRLPVAFFDVNKTGALVSRIMSDVEGIRNLLGLGMVHFAGGIMTASFALIYLYRTSVTMTAAVTAGLIVFAMGLRWAFRVIRPIYRARPIINAEVTGRLSESLSAVRVVKGYHVEGNEERVFFGGVQRLLDNGLKTLSATSLMNLSETLLMGIISVIIMLIGADQVLSGKITPGGFITYGLFLGILIAPVDEITSIGPQITEALVGLERTREVLAETPEDPDPAQKQSLGRIDGRVAFEDVGFAYDPNNPVLYDINFKVEPDTVTALVGPSGAGKSTIIGLLAAFYRPTSGCVLIDGVDLARVRLDSFRTQLGIVLQESFLFEGTIWENVAFGRPDANQQQILAACRVARVDEFAEKYEKEYETIVGERGVKLSGGQRQRVSIARAILAEPRILILDEATSNLDSESEGLIQEGLRHLMRGRTTFVIAHRLSTIRRANQILVLEEGRIIERGTHDFLYAAGGRYHSLYTMQHGLLSNLFLAPGEMTTDFAQSQVTGTEGRQNGQVYDGLPETSRRLLRIAGPEGPSGSGEI
jgi:ABC-type multidrug transport system fused ATPase/permease subunit